MIIIDDLEMPKENEQLDIVIHPDGKVCYCLDLDCKQIATARPMKHGRWIDMQYPLAGHTFISCSECGERLAIDSSYKSIINYCPICGSKMDEVEE